MNPVWFNGCENRLKMESHYPSQNININIENNNQAVEGAVTGVFTILLLFS